MSTFLITEGLNDQWSGSDTDAASCVAISSSRTNRVLTMAAPNLKTKSLFQNNAERKSCRASKKNTRHGNDVLPQDAAHL